jgi:endonuclease-3
MRKVSEMANEYIAWLYAELVAMYGIPAWEPTGDPLGELTQTILSQHTSDVNSVRAYANLRKAFPDWSAMRDAPVEAVEEAIRMGGLARLKAERIQRVLRELSAESGAAPSLDGLRDMTMEQARAALESLPGVGPKTSACVLLFALGKAAFPVDTHVLRVTRRLGLIGPKVSADRAHGILEELIPPAWRHTAHLDLIAHGRTLCSAQRPDCGHCPLRPRCQFGLMMSEVTESPIG